MSLLSQLRFRATIAPQRRMMLTGIFIASITAFGVFVLPFAFPPSHPALSGSYTAGFNNRVAAVAAALASALAFLLARPFEAVPRPRQEDDRLPIDRSVLIGCLTVCAAFTAVLGWMMTTAVVAYNDNLYFLEYMDEVVTYRLHIYRDFSFLYGPVLLYFPVAIETLLRPLHVGAQGSYYAALGIMQMAGLVLLYVTLEALPLSKSIKTITLCVFTLGTLCPLLGLNYTLVRSLLPFSTLLFASRARSPLRLSILFSLGEVLQLAVSPELGVAFAAGACFFACGRCYRQGLSFVPAIAAPFLGAAAFLAIVGKAYLDSIAKFSSGCLNLVVQPLPYILFFLFAAVWLVPVMLARRCRDREDDAVLMLSLSVVCLGLLPAALGRCDPLHVFFNGVGAYLLAAVAISSYPKRLRNLWILGLEISLVWMQLVNFTLYLPALVYAARQDIAFYKGAQENPAAEILEIEKLIGKGRVSVPFFVPRPVEEELKRAGLYQPDRECFHIGVWDATAETARVNRMNATEWTLTPAANQTITENAHISSIVVGVGFAYPERRQPYTFGNLIYRDLAVNWTAVTQSDDWILYHNNRFRSLP